MKKHLPTIIILAVVVPMAGLLGWFVLRARSAETSARPAAERAAIAVEVRTVESGMLRDVRQFTGTLESSARFTVATKVGGLVQSVMVDLGDRIEPGQIIARIDDAELVQAVAQAEADLAVRRAELARARSDLSLARREFERGEQLRERGIAAESQLDEIAARLGSAQASMQLAEAQVARAESTLVLRRIELGYAQVTATWTENAVYGSVAERYQDPGNTVEANAPIVSVVSLDPLKAVVTVTERDYAGLRVGQTAELTTDAAPGRTFEAVIQRIAPVFSETSRQARIELTVPNAESLLRPGMFARVRVVLAEAEAPAIVPLDALARREGRDVVFVLDAGGKTVRMVEVARGITEGGRVAISSPAISGRVVTMGQQLLEDGTRVRVVGQASQADDAPGQARPVTGDAP
jgi:RND family efflux transporter MFP subunit